MTRYRRSPTCSYCWASGHTKRHCPTQKKRSSDWFEKHKHLEGSEHYPSKPYYILELEAYAEGIKNRKCSWCEETGHNKRGCPDKKRVHAKSIVKNKEWRQQVLNKMKEVGLGTGALIQRQQSNGSLSPLYFVRGLDWDCLNLKSSGNTVDHYEFHKYSYKSGRTYPQFIRAVMVSTGIEHMLYAPNFTDEKNETLLYHGDDRYVVVSGSIPKPPTGWVGDESWAEKLF